MQQFTIPQFIDVEDKIIGPITTRQFIIMMSCFVLIAIFYKLFDFTTFLITGVIMFAIFGIIAFLKINGRPFHFFALNVAQTMKKPRVRIWNHIVGKAAEEEQEHVARSMEGKAAGARRLMPYEYKYYTKSRLAELSLVVDTKGVYKGEKGGAALIRSNIKEMDIL